MDFRTLPKVTIAKIEGIVGGGGNEFALSMDMRFGAIGKAVFSQTEAAVGIIAGGGGTHWLTRLMGRSRALEAMLGLLPYSAQMAERYGWINRALPADKIGPFVEMLANSIAYISADTIALVKRSVVVAEEMPRKEGLLEEGHLFAIAASALDSKGRMNEALESGLEVDEVSEIIGAGNSTIVKWRKLYHEGGEKALIRQAVYPGTRKICGALERRIKLSSLLENLSNSFFISRCAATSCSKGRVILNPTE